MAYKFDNTLVTKVLADLQFRRTGKYVGKDDRYHYAVIDPRRRNVSVWTKQQDGDFQPGERSRYRDAAKRNAQIFCTNGPPMEPPDFPTSGFLGPEERIYGGFAWSCANGTPWAPYDSVRSGGQQLDAGVGNVKWFFERNGQGSLRAYRIASGSAGGTEVLNGCYGIVAAGAVINSPDHAGLKAKESCAAWCLCPLATPLQTHDWPTEADWLEGATDPNGVPIPLDGLVVGVGTNWKPRRLAEDIVRVGCRDAVAMDGSDSSLCGSDGSLRVECNWKKDLIQRWGLFVS
jgi:hypothetical protein